MNDMEQLARRAVACDGFRWMPGMLCLTDDDGYAARVLHVGLSARTSETADSYSGGGVITRGSLKDESLPDLDDPATLGCLLEMVREACEPSRAPGDWPMVCTYQSQGKKWGVGAWLNESGKATFAALVLPTYDTEAAALVAALDAA